MPEFDSHIFDKPRDGIKKTMTELPDIVAKNAVDWVKTNFKMQGYRNTETVIM